MWHCWKKILENSQLQTRTQLTHYATTLSRFSWMRIWHKQDPLALLVITVNSFSMNLILSMSNSQQKKLKKSCVRYKEINHLDQTASTQWYYISVLSICQFHFLSSSKHLMSLGSYPKTGKRPTSAPSTRKEIDKTLETTGLSHLRQYHVKLWNL